MTLYNLSIEVADGWLYLGTGAPRRRGESPGREGPGGEADPSGWETDRNPTSPARPSRLRLERKLKP